MNTKHVVGIVGSLQEKSYNKGLMRAFVKQAPAEVIIEILDIGNLPFVNEDLESDLPEAVVAFKAKVKGADAVIFATPEYNRSIPGGLKNAIDWMSRPYGDNSIAGKPVLITSVSPGTSGGTLVHYALVQPLLHLNARLLGQPEFFVGNAGEKFTDERELTDDTTKEFIDDALVKLISMVQ